MNMNANNQERREFVRIPSQCEITAQKIHYSAKGDCEIYGEAMNICAGGMMFVMDGKCQVDDMFKVSISLQAWKKHHPQFIKVYENDITEPLVAVCQVLRTRDLDDGRQEIASKFVNVYKDDMVGLQRFVEHETDRIDAHEVSEVSNAI